AVYPVSVFITSLHPAVLGFPLNTSDPYCVEDRGNLLSTRFTTCPGLSCLSPSQGGSCLGTLGRDPAFHIQGQQTGANSWRVSPPSPSLPTFLLPPSITPSPSPA
ncbi:hypothetical protein KUCAC02_024072, partial [Chaenocephalus aceratus]